MKKSYLVLSTLAALTVFSFQNCAPVHESTSLVDQNSSANSIDSLAIFQSTLYPLLQTNCAQCHGVSQLPMFAVSNLQTSQNTLINSGLVNLKSPVSSRLVQKITEGHQSFPLALATNFEVAIADWANQLTSLDSGSGGGAGGGLPEVPQLKATFSSIHALILVPKCAGCHSPTGKRPQEDYSTYSTTLSTGKVNPGNANDSAMYTECSKGEMPEGSSDLTNEELTVMRDWINSGAAND